MAPNIYFNAVVTRWHSQCEEVGVFILYKHGGRSNNRTAKSKLLLKVRVTGSQFADDLALYTVT